MLNENVTSERRYWRDPINITKEQWIRLLEDRDIITENDA